MSIFPFFFLTDHINVGVEVVHGQKEGAVKTGLSLWYKELGRHRKMATASQRPGARPVPTSDSLVC